MQKWTSLACGLLVFGWAETTTAQISGGAGGSVRSGGSAAQRALEARRRAFQRRGATRGSAATGASAEFSRGSREINARGEARLQWERRGEPRGFGATIRNWFSTNRPQPPQQPDRKTDDSSARPQKPIELHGRVGFRVKMKRADRNLARRLAEADKLRDRAIETGNRVLMKQADRLEKTARATHAKASVQARADLKRETGQNP